MSKESAGEPTEPKKVLQHLGYFKETHKTFEFFFRLTSGTNGTKPKHQ